MVALPFLEALAPKSAIAGAPPTNPFMLLFVHQYGVQQRYRHGGPHGNEIEGFWPDVPVTQGGVASLEKDRFSALGSDGKDRRSNGGRATHELRGIENRIAVLRGVRYNEYSSDHHETRRAQMLTGSAFNYANPNPQQHEHSNAWGRNESIDNRICRELGGVRPLRYSASRLSFSQDMSGRVIENGDLSSNPREVFDQFFKVKTESADATARRKVASDLAAKELGRLNTDPRLSAADKIRVERHFDYLHAIEGKICSNVDYNAPGFASVRASQEPRKHPTEDRMIRAYEENFHFGQINTEAFCEIFAMAASCGAFRTVVMEHQTSRMDNSDVYADGGGLRGLPTFYHGVSHRTLNPDPNNGEWSGQGDYEHHLVDRWHLRRFRKIVDKLIELDALDAGMAIYSNEIATGAHQAFDVPWIIAGNCGGRIKNGIYADLQAGGERTTQMPNNRLLNTLGAAMGLNSGDGKPLHDHGGIQPDGSKDPGGYVDAIRNF